MLVVQTAQYPAGDDAARWWWSSARRRPESCGLLGTLRARGMQTVLAGGLTAPTWIEGTAKLRHETQGEIGDSQYWDDRTAVSTGDRYRGA
jgi:hypothetical protein